MIFYGLLLVFVFEYMRPGSFFPPLNIVNSVLPLVILVMALLVSGKVTNADILRERNTRWLLFFLSLIVISILVTAVVTFYSYTRFLQVLGYVFLFFMIVKLTTDLSRLKRLFATLVFIHVGLVLLNPDLILKLETRSYLQGVTFLGDGNDFALSVVIVVPMCLFLLLESKAKWLQLLYLVMLGILLLSIVGTSSRGATIAIAAVLLYQWTRSNKKLLGIAGLAVLVAAVLAIAPPSYFERMESVKDYSTEGSAQGRLDAWGAAVRMAKDHPVLGVGSGHFGMMYSNFYRPPGYEAENMKWLTAHSIYFLTMGELGIPGMVFLFAIILGNLRANMRRMREVDRLPNDARETQRRLLVCLNSSMIAFAVGGAFLSAIYYPHIYVIAGIMTVGGLLHRELLEQTSRMGAEAIEPDVSRELQRVT